MERRDFLKEQAEQFGKVLGKLLAQLLGTATGTSDLEALDKANLQAKVLLDLNVEALVGLKKSELANFAHNRLLDVAQLDVLADYLRAAGLYLRFHYPRRATDYLRSAQYLLELADERTDVFDPARMDKLVELGSMLYDM